MRGRLHGGADGRRDPACSLRESWRAGSAAAGWAFPQDWWSAPVDAVLESVLAGAPVEGPGQELGRSRAEAGVGIAEALDDVRVLARIHPQPLLLPNLESDMLRAVAVGWAEHACLRGADASCEDPLTQLVTPGYL